MKAYESNGRVMSAILDDMAKSFGGKVFVRDHQTQSTWSESSAVSNRIANFLIRDLGVVKDDKIAVVLPNCVDFIHVQFGICKSGAVMVPINVLSKLDILTQFLVNSEAKVVVIDEQYLPMLEEVAQSIPNVKTLVVRGEGYDARKLAGFNIVAYERILQGAAGHPDVEIAWYDPADIFYTSGTTGVSKGVVLSHNHHYLFGSNIVRASRLGPSDVMYVCLPLYHGMGSYMSIMPMLLCGGTIALGEQFSASRWLGEIRSYGATATWTVFSMPPILMKQPLKPDDADNPLKVMLCSGMPPDMVAPLEKRYAIKTLDFYGSTESSDLAYTSWDEERRSGAVGRVNAAFYEVAIVNEHDEVLPVGEIGECVSRCKQPFSQMSEYYKMPEETLKAFRNRWLHTGDLCRLDKDGFLYFVGRGKDTIRRRGENISCYELETILSGYEGVLECSSVPVPSELGEDEIKIIIAPREGATLEFSAVMGFCREKMPKFMIPRYIEIVPEVHKLPNHKIDKARLKKEGLTPMTWDAESGGYVGDRGKL